MNTLCSLGLTGDCGQLLNNLSSYDSDYPYLQGQDICMYAGVGYAAIYRAQGLASWTWSVSGVTPPGLMVQTNFPSAGLVEISGTVTEPGNYNLIIAVADSFGAVFTAILNFQVLPLPTDASSPLCSGFSFGSNPPPIPTGGGGGSGETLYWVCSDGTVVTINVPSGASIVLIDQLIVAASNSCFGVPPPPPPPPPGANPPDTGNGGGGSPVRPPPKRGKPEIIVYGNDRQVAYWSCPEQLSPADWQNEYNAADPPTQAFLVAAQAALTANAPNGAYTIQPGTYFASSLAAANHHAAAAAQALANGAPVCFSCLIDGSTGLCIPDAPLNPGTLELSILFTGKPLTTSLINPPNPPNLPVLDIYEIINIDGSHNPDGSINAVPAGLTANGLGPSNLGLITFTGISTSVNIYRFTVQVTTMTPGPYFGQVYTKDYVLQAYPSLAAALYWSFDTEIVSPLSWANVVNLSSTAYAMVSSNGPFLVGAGILGNGLEAPIPSMSGYTLCSAATTLFNGDPLIQSLFASPTGYTIRLWVNGTFSLVGINHSFVVELKTYGADILVFTWPFSGNQFVASVNGGEYASVLFGAPAGWHRVVVTLDFVHQQVGVQIDNNAPSISPAAGVIGGAVPPGSVGVTVEITQDPGAAHICLVDEVGIWNYPWTASQSTDDWNGGAGKTWPAP